MFGAPQKLVSEAQEAKAAVNFPIWKENMPTVSAFMMLQTQWMVGPMGQLMGLNYSSVEAVFGILGTKNKRRVFEGLRVMELTALEVVRKMEKKG